MTTVPNPVLRAFNNQLIEFLNDVLAVFPENGDILSAKNAAVMTRKANPTVLARQWHQHIGRTYGEQIAAGNMDFFIDKDYSTDVASVPGHSDRVIDAINKLRDPVRQMDEANRDKTMKYMQNLTVLAAGYVDLSK
jgi:hypothetical protein